MVGFDNKKYLKKIKVDDKQSFTRYQSYNNENEKPHQASSPLRHVYGTNDQ